MKKDQKILLIILGTSEALSKKDIKSKPVNDRLEDGGKVV
jgi:hypothetical protein